MHLILIAFWMFFYLCIYPDTLLICTAEYDSNLLLLLIETVLLSTHDNDDICSEWEMGEIKVPMHDLVWMHVY